MILSYNIEYLCISFKILSISLQLIHSVFHAKTFKSKLGFIFKRGSFFFFKFNIFLAISNLSFFVGSVNIIFLSNLDNTALSIEFI